MPKKTKIIFITVFIIVGLLVLGFYLFSNKNNTGEEDKTPWYQNFNPFGSGNKKTGEGLEGTETGGLVTGEQKVLSKFYQITDFAIAGATFLDDTRLKEGAETPKEEIKTIISTDTVEGRKEIQNILNKTLSLKPQLIIDGVFGKSVTEAIKKFQTLNNITVTGKIDEVTAPYFTKTVSSEVESPFETAPSIRYVERKNGHIYKMFLDTKDKEKISNSTIPSIYEALFNNTANSVIYRYLSTDKTISTFMATLGKPAGEYLPQNITDLSTSPDKTKFFYLAENPNGVTGTMGTFGLSNKEIVFNSPLTEWLSEWDSGQRVYLTTKPSYSASGSMFLLNPTNKTISKVFGGVQGLTTKISPNGSLVLFGESTQTGPKLGVFNIKDHTTKNLNSYGLPEKCVWSKNSIDVYCAVPNVITGNQYPDSWYQGLVSFDDFFIKINTQSGNKTSIANSVEETPIDATYLFLERSEDTLFFTNKKDLTLWSLNLR